MKKQLRVLKITSPNELKAALEIRTRVFVEEQQVPAELEYDEHDSECTHYLATWDKTNVGTARWRHTDKGIKLERFAVLKQFRNKGIGKALVNEVLKDLSNEHKTIYLNAQVQVIPFYEKLGFSTLGDFFEEAGIQHKVMVKEGQLL
jgi:predicted GNAT family N-acyltransferase